MTETQDDTGLYASAEDTPSEARIRHSLVRKFAAAGAQATENPHLAADVAMQIMVPALEMVKAEAEVTVRTAKTAVADAAEKTLTQRLKVVEAAARASERAACAAQLRAEAAHLAAAALEARGADVAVMARDAGSLKTAADRLASQSRAAQ